MNAINLTPVLDAIVKLCAVLITAFLIPWLKEKWGKERTARIFKNAGIAVRAAEQMYRESGSGTKKLNYVLQYLKNHGFDLSADELRATVEAAVYDMKNAVDAAQ